MDRTRTEEGEMRTTARKATAVEFECYGEGLIGGRIPREQVAVAEALRFGTEHNANPVKVFWDGGGWSWAKGWKRWDSKRKVRELVLIGAGAYGDTEICRAAGDIRIGRF